LDVDYEGTIGAALTARSGMHDNRCEPGLDDGGTKYGLTWVQVLQIIARRVDAAELAKSHRSLSNVGFARQRLYLEHTSEIDNFPATDGSPCDDLNVITVVNKSEQFEMPSVETPDQLLHVAIACKGSARESDFNFPYLASIAPFDRIVDGAQLRMGIASRHGGLCIPP
jgi:hypothetical protein